MTPEETLRWLTGLRNLGSRLGVERMRLLAARLGHPERAAPCLHVAGTNGKGSVCAMIEAIQRAHGRRAPLRAGGVRRGRDGAARAAAL